MSKFNNRETTYYVAQARIDGDGKIESVLVINNYGTKDVRHTERLSDGREYTDRTKAIQAARYLNLFMRASDVDDVVYYMVTNDQNKTITVNENDVPAAFKGFFGIEKEEEDEDEEPEPEPEEEEDEDEEEDATEEETTDE